MPGDTHYLIVAIENYNDPKEFSRVSFAEKDAKEVADAFIQLDANPDNMVFLLNGHATANSIEHNLIKMVEKAKENDRIVFYFSGHGLNIAGDNLLVPADAIYDRAKDMCVSINVILKHLTKAKSVQKILFLDCCHSGIEPGEYVRADTKSFAGDALEYQFKGAEFCIGFAACKSKQKSISHPMLSNGVWSHFLIKALRGDAESDVYDEGCILAGKLQTYLRDNTYEYLQKHTTDKKVQTPIQFGSSTGDFIVANINPIFEKRAIAKTASKLKLQSVSMYIVEEGKIKDLDSFDKKRGHFIPDKVASAHDKFVKNASGNMVEEEISQLSQEIKAKLKYKRTDMQVNTAPGEGYIETPDFSFSIVVKQSESDPSRYVVRRTLEEIENPDIIHDPKFNQIFDKYFDSLSFRFDKPINVTRWIDTFEERGLDIDYDPAKLDRCTLKLDGLDTEIIIMRESLDIFFTYTQSPHFIIDAYKKASIQLEVAKIHLLN